MATFNPMTLQDHIEEARRDFPEASAYELRELAARDLAHMNAWRAVYKLEKQPHTVQAMAKLDWATEEAWHRLDEYFKMLNAKYDGA